MKADKTVAGADAAITKQNNILTMDKKSRDLAKNNAFLTFLPLLSLLAVTLLGFLKVLDVIEIVKIGVLTLVLTAATVFFIRLQGEELLTKRYSKTIITLSYIGSICLIMLPFPPEIFSFWMIGGLVVAMLIDNKLGLLIYFDLTFILGIIVSLSPESTIQLLIMGVLMCLLSAALRQRTTVIYAAVIILSTNITLAFVINNFIFEVETNYNYLTSFFSIFAVLATAFFISRLYDRNSSETMVSQFNLEEHAADIESKSELSALELFREPETEDAADETIPTESELPLTVYTKGLRTSCEVLLNEDNELLVKLKEFSNALFEHCTRIGDISGRAAKTIGADDMLAKAGGMYHEIGKINGKNYMEEGLKIAEQYSFPKEVTSILKQHNIKYDKPTSIEAAIVMLSDNVVSTIDYIQKTGENKFTVEKIIDNIFQLRMEKGTFDESGLSVKDFKQLKEFYISEFKA